MIDINPTSAPETRTSPAALTLSVAWACAALVPAHAQTPGPVVALDAVVVSGSRHEQRIDEQPTTIDVIDRADMERKQIQDIRDAARDLPNVSVKRAPERFALTGAPNSTGRDGNAGFNIRGLGGNRVLMMVDGVRQPHSYVFGGNAFGRDYLALDLIKRIEVVRGPASALYGSDGMAGLVNLVTHEPADFLVGADKAPKRQGGRLGLAWTGADEGLGVGATYAARASDTVEWLVTATGRRGHALDTMGVRETPNLDRTVPNPQRDRDQAVMAKIVVRPMAAHKHVLTLEHVDKATDVQLLSSRARLPLTGTAAQVAAAVLDEQAEGTRSRDRITWDARYPLGARLADQVQTVLGVQRTASRQTGTSDINRNADRVRDTRYSEHTWQLGIQADKSHSLSDHWGHKLTYGVEYLSSDIYNLYTGVTPLAPEVFPLKRFPDTRESGSALFAQGEWFNEQWNIVPGVRWDQFAVDVKTQAGFYPPAKLPARSLSGSAVSPKLAVLYRAAPGWSVFGHFAGGFRAPNANQVNGYYENMGEQVVIVPNPDLKPEKSRNIEFGLRARLPQLRLDVAVFSGRFQHLIVDNVLVSGTGVAGDPKRFQTQNTDRARIQGVEIKGVADWGLVGGGRLSTPFAFGRAQGVNTNNAKPLNSIDPAKVQVGLNYARADWTLRLDWRHHAAKKAQDIDSQASVKLPNVQITTPSATTADLHLQWRLRKDLRIHGGITNLTNRKYWMWADVQGLAASTTVADAYTQPGRKFDLALVADF